jgi:hypothetical protein
MPGTSRPGRMSGWWLFAARARSIDLRPSPCDSSPPSPPGSHSPRPRPSRPRSSPRLPRPSSRRGRRSTWRWPGVRDLARVPPVAALRARRPALPHAQPRATTRAGYGNNILPGDCDANSTNPLPVYSPANVDIIEIDVVFHVLQATNGQGNVSNALIQSQIDILNEDYRALPGTLGAPASTRRSNSGSRRWTRRATPRRASRARRTTTGTTTSATTGRRSRGTRGGT